MSFLFTVEGATMSGDNDAPFGVLVNNAMYTDFVIASSEHLRIWRPEQALSRFPYPVP